MLYNKSIDKFFSEESMLDFSTMIYRIPALLFAITIHEYAHAQCADSMGDPTARYMGRMTFNPMAHLDPLGAILLVVAGFGWAKPVEINQNFPHPPRGYSEGFLCRSRSQSVFVLSRSILHDVFKSLRSFE